MERKKPDDHFLDLTGAFSGISGLVRKPHLSHPFQSSTSHTTFDMLSPVSWLTVRSHQWQHWCQRNWTATGDSPVPRSNCRGLSEDPTAALFDRFLAQGARHDAWNTSADVRNPRGVRLARPSTPEPQFASHGGVIDWVYGLKIILTIPRIFLGWWCSYNIQKLNGDAFSLFI